MITAINPYTGETLKSYPETEAGELPGILERAHRAYLGWRRSGYVERATLLRKVGARLREGKEELSRLMALEMGKPIGQGRGEIEKCAWVCDYYAERSEEFLKPMEVPTETERSLVVFEPLGVILAVMPWNFPFWQFFRAAAPALMAGNAVVLKHASNVPGCALAIGDLFRIAECPAGLVEVALIPSRLVGACLEHRHVRAVTLTGSTPAGSAVAARAGALLKKTVLELGGSDPYLVLADADLNHAAETCATARLINSGQSCIAAKRFIVAETVIDPFTELLIAAMRRRKMGDPLDESVQLGPLARADLREDLHGLVKVSIERGARLLLGGEMAEGRGFFYPPTVLGSVRPGVPVYYEETFGPVAAVISAHEEEEAIRIANDTSFGLGAGVFTRDLRRGEFIASKELEAGCCFVNDSVRSDPRLPFGGIKDSGYGRELGVFGIREFVNIKTVVVKKV